VDQIRNCGGGCGERGQAGLPIWGSVSRLRGRETAKTGTWNPSPTAATGRGNLTRFVCLDPGPSSRPRSRRDGWIDVDWVTTPRTAAACPCPKDDSQQGIAGCYGVPCRAGQKCTVGRLSIVRMADPRDCRLCFAAFVCVREWQWDTQMPGMGRRGLSQAPRRGNTDQKAI